MPDIARRALSRANFRFEIVPCHESHMDCLFEAAMESVAHISPWMAWLHPGYSLDDGRNWSRHTIQAWDDGTEFEFSILDRTDGSIAGRCGLNQINSKDLVANLGYWVRASRLRMGAATQAVALLREFGFESLGLNRLEIMVAEGNHASRAVAEKSGAIYEGRQRARVRVGEKVHDGHLYALIRPGLRVVTDA